MHFSIRCLSVLLAGLFLFSCVKEREEEIIVHIADNRADHPMEITDFFRIDKSMVVRYDSTSSFHPTSFSIKFYPYNGKVYVSDGNSIASFSEDGDMDFLLKKLGRGPDEYITVTDFCVVDGVIYINDGGSSRLISYSLDGEFLAKNDLPVLCGDFCIFNGKLFLKSMEHCGTNSIVIVDPETMQILSGCVPTTETETRCRMFLGFQSFYVTNEGLVFHESIRNTVYLLDTAGLKRSVYIDFFGRNFPESIWEKNMDNVMELLTEIRNGRYVSGISHFAGTPEDFVCTCTDFRVGESLLCGYSGGQSVLCDTVIIDGSAFSVSDIGMYLVSESDMIITYPIGENETGVKFVSLQ